MHRTLFRALLAACLLASSVEAHHLLDSHTLTCDPDFPCPEEMQGRVEFWIDIFQKYSTEEAVFHDLERPDRVYSVIRTPESCLGRGRESSAVNQERERLRNVLYEMARKIEQDQRLWVEEESHLLKMFPSEAPDDLRAGADNIRCQAGNRDHFVEALQRYGAYRDFVTSSLKSAGLPEDLQYLPFVESSYNPQAVSRVGAAGLWQIMPRTARRLGLRINDTVDERLDPEAATLGAVKYFRNSYDELRKLSGTFDRMREPFALGPFVVTSYNYGLGGIRRAMQEIGPNFVQVLNEYGGRSFHVAVKNFYASFLAARHVAKNAKSFFAKAKYDPHFEYDAIEVPRPTSVQRLSAQLGVSVEELRRLNLSLTERVWSGRRLVPEHFPLRLPKGRKKWEPLVASLDQLPPEVLQFSAESYRVKSGDTAWGIARKFSISFKELVAANDLGPKGRVRSGQIVTIPGRGPIVVASGPTKGRATPQAPMVALAVRPTPFTRAAPTTTAVPPSAAAPEPLPDLAAFTPATEGGAPAFGVNQELLVLTETKGKEKSYLVQVEPEETLELYAEWLGIEGKLPVEALGNPEGTRELALGSKLRLPISRESERKAFETKRIEYHRTLQDEFKEKYDIIGQEVYKIEPKDSVSVKEIAAQLNVPVWLLAQFNPNLLRRTFKPGDTIDYPAILEREKETPKARAPAKETAIQAMPTPAPEAPIRMKGLP